MSTFSFVSAKLGNVKASTKKIALELHTEAAKAGHEIWYMWGMGSGSEHATGLALDLMVRNERGGDFVRNYIWANRKRLRLRHVIWEQHITSTVSQPGVRRRMADRGSVTENHFDHVHALFLPGSYQSTDGAPTPPVTPSKAPVARVRTLYWNTAKMMSGDDISTLQKGMRRVFPSYAGHLEVDGKFGSETHRVILEFQRRANLAVDGIVGLNTRKALRQYGVRL